jgi:hypothetical protein
MTKQTLINNLFNVINSSPAIASNRAERIAKWAARQQQSGDYEAKNTYKLARALHAHRHVLINLRLEDFDEAARHSNVRDRELASFLA